MAGVRVPYINTVPRGDLHDQMTHVEGAIWRYARRDVMISSATGSNNFYLLVANKRSEIDVVTVRDSKYVSMHTDKNWNDSPPAMSTELPTEPQVEAT